MHSLNISLKSRETMTFTSRTSKGKCDEVLSCFEEDLPRCSPHNKLSKEDQNQTKRQILDKSSSSIF